MIKNICYFHGIDCGSNTYGGFNGTDCQPCPPNTTNEGGYFISSCACIQPPYIGKSLWELMFKVSHSPYVSSLW